MNLSALRTSILVLLLGGAVLLSPVGAAPPVIVGLMSVDAEKHNVEFQQYDRMIPVYREHGISPVLVEQQPFMGGARSAEQIYELLKPLHALVLTTTTEGHETVHLTPAQEAYGRMVGEALARYVREGGGLFLQAQSVRYANTDDEKYWNVVMAPLGAELLHEGCFDPTRAMEGVDLGRTTYWFTQNVEPHPVTESIQRLYLPLYGPGKWPGLPAMRYSAEWQVVAAGEAEARSFASDIENILRLENPGSYSSAPPVVAVREFGRGRIVSFPLSPIHSGMNYGNPLWRHTVETEGDRAAGLRSDTLKLLMQCYRWVAEPARAAPELGTYVPKPYETVRFPESVDWDRFEFNLPTGGVRDFAYADGQTMDFMPAVEGVRGIFGARSAYSGGGGTVAEYAEAARKSGLSFVVFADPLEELTPNTLEQLKQDCLEASVEGEFYACPGILFTDGIGLRWYFWGEKIVFPAATIDSYGREFPLWDGERVLHYGAYNHNSAFPGSALLDYRQLAEKGAHRENLWWFFHYLPFVYEGDKLVADNYQEYLFGLRDMRWAALASFTGIESPEDVRLAARTLVTSFRDLPSARQGLNTRCGAYGSAYAGRQYVTQGPSIVTFDAINQQMEENWQFTRGAQRVRLKFIVRSPEGIREVRVHDADTGVIRRFLGRGEKELAREFEVVSDQQHYLTLEVLDTAGRRAVSWYVFVFSYKQGLFRCGDNLNILGATGLLWHPDRNEMMNAAKQWENAMDFGIRGWDAGGYLCPMPGAGLRDQIRTSEGWYPEFRRDGHAGKILDMSLSSYNLQIATQEMTMLAEPYDTDARPTPALASPPRDLGPIEMFERTHTIYAPATRTDWYTAWNYRRPHEGARDYRGGMIWHEGEVRFTKDVTLAGAVPVPLVRMSCPTDLEQGWGKVVMVKESAQGPTRVALLRDTKEPARLTGRLRAGGYVTQMPSLVGYMGFLAPPGYEYSYDVSVSANPQGPGFIEIGLGHDGQVVKAGTVWRYRFAFGTFADDRGGNALLEDTVAALNLAGAGPGYEVQMRAGSLADSTFFLTARARGHEAAFSLGKRDLIIDLPMRIEGLQDNGCAAVYTTSRPWFRFVPVVGTTAYFQESTQADNEVWVGNVFVAEHPALRLTLIADGQAEGRKPRLEVHNPTDRAILTRVYSPPRTPRFGGMSERLTVPAGDSLWLEIDGRRLVAAGG